MSMWDKLQKELDRAGDAARGALDEGKLRIELFRVRQMADKAAEALGYAVHRARKEGKDLEPEVLERLDAALPSLLAHCDGSFEKLWELLQVTEPWGGQSTLVEEHLREKGWWKNA